LGGLTSFVRIEEERRLLRAGKVSVKSDMPTHLKTKALIESCDTIKEIAQSRNMTEGTILNHLTILKKEEADIDLSKFKSITKAMKTIEQSILKLEKEKKKEHFTEDGRLRLKAIFDDLNAKVSYDDIRRCMLFIA
jgi:hypothetical protein